MQAANAWRTGSMLGIIIINIEIVHEVHKKKAKNKLRCIGGQIPS